MARLLPLLLLSCAGISPPAHTGLGRSPTAEEQSTRPEAVREARQERWILRRGSTEIVFTLLIEFEDGLQFAALDDLGSVLADSAGRSSRALSESLVARLAALLRAMYQPADLRPVLVENGVGWAGAGVLWVGTTLYTEGMRVQHLGPNRYEVSGALSATVTVG